MNILLCERINDANQYIEELAKAYEADGHSVILDVQNFLYSSFTPDFLHIQWPEAIYSWRYRLAKSDANINLIENRLIWYKEKNIPIIYTVHNLFPHQEVNDFDEKIYHLILKNADIIVHHGQSSIDIIKSNISFAEKGRHIVCPHGPYTAEVRDPLTSRTKYHLPNKYVFLNFGRIRKNKGLGFTESVFRRWSNSRALLFTIGSKTQPQNTINRLTEKLTSPLKNSLSTKIRSNFKKIAHDEIPTIMAASDVVFLGHQSGLNSGIATLAASYGKPIVYPELGNFSEQLVDWPWQVSYKTGDLCSAIRALDFMMKIIENYKPGEIIFENEKWKQTNSWEKHIHNILESI